MNSTGHIGLGTLPQSKKWRDVIGLLDSAASLEDVAEAAAKASESDLRKVSEDPDFQFVTRLLVKLPLLARPPGFEVAMAKLGIERSALESVTGLLAGLNDAMSQQTFALGRSSDAGEMARAASLESLSVQMRDRLPTLFEPTPQEVRKALASFASGQNFAGLARDFFARLSYRVSSQYKSTAWTLARAAEMVDSCPELGQRMGDDVLRGECRLILIIERVFDMLKPALLSLLALGFASQAGASVYLQYSDTDSLGMADINVPYGATTSFVDIMFDGVAAGNSTLNGF